MSPPANAAAPKVAAPEPRRMPAVSASASGPAPTRIFVVPPRPAARPAAPQPRPIVTSAAAPSAAAIPAPAPTPAAPPPPAENPILATFLDLEEDFRRARELDSLRTALVTGARKLVPYDCALLVERDPPLRADGIAVWRVRAASGVSGVDRRSPFVQAFERLVADLARIDEAQLAERQETVLGADDADDDLAGFTADFPHLLWTPLFRPDGTQIGALATFQEDPATRVETTLLSAIAGPWGHAFAALAERGWDLRARLGGKLGNARQGLWALALAALVLAFPVHLSVLAPAEVVGTRTMPMAAPVDGVIREIFVEPGDRVEAGAPLFRLVDTKLRNEMEVAEKARAVALAKHQRAVQGTVANHGDGREIAVAKADLDVAEAELALARDLYDRTRVTAPRAGIAVYSARTDWIGRPVSTGERVMDIVDPGDLELRIDLGMSDALDLKTGTAVRLFQDGDPLSPVSAEVTRIGYRPVANAERQMVYRVFAGFAEGAAPRLGARGTARIDGERVTLAFYLLRRPLAALRQKIGM